MLDLALFSYFNQIQTTSSPFSKKSTEKAPPSKTKPAETTDTKTTSVAQSILNAVLESLSGGLRDFGENAPGGGAVLVVIPQY